MGLIDQISKPVEKLKEIRGKVQARNQKQLFFQEQFQVMVENGNVDKAVELIPDEAKNLNARLTKEITPGELAQYSMEKCQEILDEIGEDENFQRAVEKLEDDFDFEQEDENVD